MSDARESKLSVSFYNPCESGFSVLLEEFVYKSVAKDKSEDSYKSFRLCIPVTGSGRTSRNRHVSGNGCLPACQHRHDREGREHARLCLINMAARRLPARTSEGARDKNGRRARV